MLTLVAVEEGADRRVWCVTEPSTLRYLSRNSIYGAIAEETWQVSATGINIRGVRSAPVVLDYYGIVDYRLMPDGMAEGVPLMSQYPLLRIKASPRGEQRLLAGNEELDISSRFAEGVVLVVTPRLALRIAPCLLP